MAIGRPVKKHRFDLVSKDEKYIVECKNYSWTNSGNIPAAKMAIMNETLLYLSNVAGRKHRFIIVPESGHNRREETLASYYVRTYRHLFNGIKVLEIDRNNRIRLVS